MATKKKNFTGEGFGEIIGPTGEPYYPSTAIPKATTTLKTTAKSSGPVRIGGVLYPSQEWYDIHIAKKQTSTTTTKPSAIQEIEKKIAETKSKIQKYTKALNLAKQQGITTGEIPADVLAKAGVNIEMPNKIPDTTPIDNIKFSADAWQKYYQDTIAKYMEELKSAEKERMNFLQKIGQTLTGSKISTLQRQLQEKYQVPEQYQKILDLQPKITALQNQLADIDKRYNTAITAVESAPVSNALITGRQAALKRQWAAERAGVAAELGAQQAIAEMYRGNIQQARQLISDAIDAATFDEKQRLTDYQMFYDYYGDYVKTLDSRIQDAIKSGFELAQLEEEKARKEKDTIANLMLQYPEAGISLRDDYDTAIQKTQSYLRVHPELQTREGWRIVENPITGVPIGRINVYTGKYEPIEISEEEKNEMLQGTIPSSQTTATKTTKKKGIFSKFFSWIKSKLHKPSNAIPESQTTQELMQYLEEGQGDYRFWDTDEYQKALKQIQGK